jgi:hypothetical protein
VVEEKKERLFVIMEVEEDQGHGDTHYHPVGRPTGEALYLRPDSIIPASRLRYGVPKPGDKFFRDNWRWIEAEMNYSHQRLILDPAPEEKKDEWEEWAEDSPVCDPDSNLGREIIAWLKRMPRDKND